MASERTGHAVALAAVVLAGFAAGAAAGDPVAAAVFAVAVLGLHRFFGYAGVVAVGVVTLALASSSYEELKTPALDQRWIALGTLAVWPIVSRVRLTPIDAPALVGALGLFASLAVLSAAWSIDSRLTVERAATFAALVVAATVVLPAHMRGEADRLRLVRVLAVVVTAGAVVALVLGVVDPDVGREDGPLQGWFENSNTLGIWCAALAPMLFGLPDLRARAIAALPVAAAIIWSESRGALFALVVIGLAALPVSLPRRVAVAAGLAAAILVVAVSPVGDATAIGKFGEGDPIRAATGARDEAWDVTVELIRINPVEGFGFGTADAAFELAELRFQFVHFVGGNPNSAPLQAWLELGVLGFLLLIGAAVGSVVAGWRRRLHGARGLFLYTGTALVVASLVESILTSAGNPFAYLAWGSLALALGLDSAAMSSQATEAPASKDTVRDFWNEQPCGSKHAQSQSGTPEFFEEVERSRAELEPFIEHYANFEGARGKHVLEIGCGLGTDLVRFARAGATVTGLDLTPRAVELVQRRLELEGLNGEVVTGDAEALPFGDGSFDRVYSWGVLHHTPDARGAVREAVRVLRPGGELCVMLYARHSWVGYGLWTRHALFRARPWRSLADVIAHNMESDGTKAYTKSELRLMFDGVEELSFERVLTPYDVRVGGPIARATGSALGWFFVIRGRAPGAG